MQDPLNPDRRLLKFPVWMLIHPELRENALIQTDHEAGCPGTPLFTSMASVERFQDLGSGLDEYAPIDIRSPSELDSFLDLFQVKGMLYVAFDPGSSESSVCRIEELREALSDAILYPDPNNN